MLSTFNYQVEVDHQRQSRTLDAKENKYLYHLAHSEEPRDKENWSMPGKGLQSSQHHVVSLLKQPRSLEGMKHSTKNPMFPYKGTRFRHTAVSRLKNPALTSRTNEITFYTGHI